MASENAAYDTVGDHTQPEQTVVDVPEKKGGLDAGFTNISNAPEEVPPKADKPYAGMGKEDLLRFSDTPFWNRFRMACLIIFWLAWLGLLIAVIVLTITYPRCQAPEEKSWWQKSVFYQIYVRSFADGNGNDGVGDLQGIIDNLDYLEEINANALILSSIYESDIDFGYGITDFMAIDNDYGSMETFETLLNYTHHKGMKVILDFVPNHSSKNHPWFVQSQSSSDTSNAYWNYYVWADCPTPTNWMSVYGEPMWTQITGGRAQCYLHQFLEEQPDLNLRSASVQNELESILRFWLEKGVDGFRVNSAKYLFEDTDLTSYPSGSPCSEQDATTCMHTQNLDEVHGMIARWRTLVDQYSTEDNPRILMTDALNNAAVNLSIAYYGRFGNNEANLPVNYQLKEYGQSSNAADMRDYINSWLMNMPPGKTANWLTGYQDKSRMPTTVSAKYMNALNIIKFTLPGSTLVLYGEEIGMVNGDLTSNCQGNPSLLYCDPAGLIKAEFDRANYRTPMQWSENNGGWSSPWIPVNSGHEELNVEVLRNATHGDNIFPKFKELANMRRTQNSLHYGNFDWLLTDNDHVVSYLREYEGDDRILVAVNFGTADAEVNLAAENSLIPGAAEVLLVTDDEMDIKVGDNADLRRLTLSPGDGIVVTWAYTR